MTAPISPYATPAKPPLTPEVKRAARNAGMVGFGLLSIGWALFGGAAGIALFAAFFAFVIGLMDRFGGTRDAGYYRLLEVIDAIDPEAWVVPLVAAAVIGLALLIGALFLSAGILRRAGHPSPWGVTWAGAGVAIAASWFVSWLAWLPGQLIGMLAQTGGDDITAIAVGAVVGGVLQLGIVLMLGWLSWWWMAHALRRS